MEIRIHTVELPMKRALTITHGTTESLRNIVVELIDGELRGYGESAPLPYYGVTADSIAASLRAARRRIEETPWQSPEELWDRLLPVLGHDRFALCAVDLAAHDLWGKKLKKQVYELWGLSRADCPPTNYTIGLDPPDVMALKIREAPGFGCYKIKLNADDPVGRVRVLRRETDAVFRVDANTAWTAEQTIVWARELRDLGVEFIEQPLPAENISAMPAVRRDSGLPIIADENCVVPEDVERCASAFDGVNIKLTKAGGLTAARRMVADARRRGLKVMVGCMTETSIGIGAIAQIAPMLDYVDMDGALLLADDIADGVRINGGVVEYSDQPGLGFSLRRSFS